jgi:hypothetical protein
MKENCLHFVASDKPVGEVIESNGVCGEVSAGHNKHEYTTGYAFDEIVKYFNLA